MTKWVRVRLANSLTFFIALPLGRLTNRRVRIGGKPAGGTMVPNHGLALRYPPFTPNGRCARYFCRCGEVAEWLKAPVSKTGIPLWGIAGSNPALSAILHRESPRPSAILYLI